MPAIQDIVRKVRGLNWRKNRCDQCGRRFDGFVDYPYRKIIRLQGGLVFCCERCRENYFRRR